MTLTEAYNFQYVTQHKSKPLLLERVKKKKKKPSKLIKFLGTLSCCMHMFHQMLNILLSLQLIYTVVYKTG